MREAAWAVVWADVVVLAVREAAPVAPGERPRRLTTEGAERTSDKPSTVIQA